MQIFVDQLSVICRVAGVFFGSIHPVVCGHMQCICAECGWIYHLLHQKSIISTIKYFISIYSTIVCNAFIGKYKQKSTGFSGIVINVDHIIRLMEAYKLFMKYVCESTNQTLMKIGQIMLENGWWKIYIISKRVIN